MLALQAMALSAAAVSSNMGKYAINPVDGFIGMTGLGLGRWLNGKVDTTKEGWKTHVFRWFPNAVFMLLALLAIFVPQDQHNISRNPTSLRDLYNISNIMVLLFLSFIIFYTTLGTAYQRALTPIFQWIAEVARIHGGKPLAASMSDGGHSENLAALPLLVAKDKVIIICDGGQDSEGMFADLRLLVKSARKFLGCRFYAADITKQDVSRDLLDFDRKLEDFRKGFRPWNIGLKDEQMREWLGNDSDYEQLDKHCRSLKFCVRYSGGTRVGFPL